MAISRKKIVSIAVVVVILVSICLVVIVLKPWSNDNNRLESDNDVVGSVEPGVQVYKLESDPNILMDYINTRDDTYAYTTLQERTQRDEREGFTSYVLNMTSQQWFTSEYSDHDVWWHYVIITVPDAIVYKDLGLLFVSSGSNDNGLPDPLTDVECRLISHMATTLGVVTAVLKQVPNEPITFTNDPERKPRSGASIIAYTLRAILEGTVDEYHSIALFPMVKSVVRAMDTVTNFTDQAVNRFYVSGAAERGWVTWLTAAVDDRIVGIAPLVYGNLNFVKNLKDQQRSLGGYSWGLSPYWEQNITHYIDEPTAESILSVLEPLAYNKFLTMPKYIVLSSNDEQYMPDCTKYFYQSMKEPVFLRIYPNTDNSLLGSWNRMVNDFTGFILSVEEKWTLPDVRWNLTETNDAVTVSIRTNLRPLSFTRWVADTPTDARRDFRLRISKGVNMSESIPQSVLFQKTKIEDPGVEFETTLAKPSNGWVGIFIEIVFPAPNGTHFTVTTDMSVIPDVYPLEEECSGDSCVGRLV